MFWQVFSLLGGLAPAMDQVPLVSPPALLDCNAGHPQHRHLHYDQTQCRKPHEKLDDIRHFWGQYSPYFSSPSTISPGTPAECNTTFVQILARHGSRFPTLHKTKRYADLFDRFLPRLSPEVLKGRYAFLSDYNYTLGDSDLTTVGSMEIHRLAVDSYQQYKELLDDSAIATPFIRAAGSSRVIESARIFSQTLHAALLDDLPPSEDPDSVTAPPILIIPEDGYTNNTLDSSTCPNIHEHPWNLFGKHAQEAFADQRILQIADRVNAELQLRSNNRLSIQEVIQLMDVCAFETVALLHPFPPSNRTLDGTGISPVCGVFDDNDFRAYDYHQSLGKFYGYGIGNPLAPSIGIGFVNELVARLTDGKICRTIGTNRTLNNDPNTFPVGIDKHGKRHRIFADFSHDNTMAAVHAAIGLWDALEPLPITHIEDGPLADGFSAKSTVPFGARTVFEKMSCEGYHEELIRVLMNGRVLPLRQCHADKQGRCKLTSFLDSLVFVKSGGNFSKCFE